MQQYDFAYIREPRIVGIRDAKARWSVCRIFACRGQRTPIIHWQREPNQYGTASSTNNGRLLCRMDVLHEQQYPFITSQDYPNRAYIL